MELNTGEIFTRFKRLMADLAENKWTLEQAMAKVYNEGARDAGSTDSDLATFEIESLYRRKFPDWKESFEQCYNDFIDEKQEPIGGECHCRCRCDIYGCDDPDDCECCEYGECTCKCECGKLGYRLPVTPLLIEIFTTCYNDAIRSARPMAA